MPDVMPRGDSQIATLARILARTAQALARVGEEEAARLAFGQGLSAGQRLGRPAPRHTRPEDDQ